MSEIISPSGFAPGLTFITGRILCTLRSEFVKVPSFSAKVAAGRTTSASAAVSLMNTS